MIVIIINTLILYFLLFLAQNIITGSDSDTVISKLSLPIFMKMFHGLKRHLFPMKTGYLLTSTELSMTRLCELLRNFCRAAISHRCKSTSLMVSYVKNFSSRGCPFGAHCCSPQGHSDLSQPAQRACSL